MNNQKKLYATMHSWRVKFQKLNPNLKDVPGIYVLYRIDENGFKFAYVGQSVKVLQRLVSHAMGYEQHIDKSIRKHKLYDEFKNRYGYKVEIYEVAIEELDKAEQYFIKVYADKGYQLRNKTLGGQCEGKTGINDNEPSKGYRDGIAQGYNNCRKEVAEYFEKYLNVTMKEPFINKNGTVNLLKQKKLQEFKEWLKNAPTN